jgi:hypothetical protein
MLLVLVGAGIPGARHEQQSGAQLFGGGLV